MKDLSKPDLNLMMDLIYESLTCSSETGFLSLADKLRTLIGFTHIRSLVGDSEQYKIKKMAALNMITSFPEEWEKHYIEKKYFDWDNVAYVAFRHQGLIHWDDCQNLPALSQKRNQRSKRILGEAASIGLKEGWLFSMPGRKTTEFTILSVASEDIDKSIRTKTILDYVSPHLALAVSSTVMSQRPLPAQLTKREKEVLSWVAAGKTAWEISEIIKVSRRTVEFHISNILAKLDAVNSQQAIAIALSSGLINY